jgi:hypothetical protein
MKLKPTTREFLLAAGFVVSALVVGLGWFMWRFAGAVGVDSEGALQGFLIDGALFALVLVLGIGAAWFRLVRDRRARRNRKPPMTLG